MGRRGRPKRNARKRKSRRNEGPKATLGDVQPPLSHMARLSEPLGVDSITPGGFCEGGENTKGAMPKRWKPERRPTKRDLLKTLLMGGIVVWLAGLTGLILSSYLYQ